MYDGGYGDGTYFDQQQQQGHYSQQAQAQHQYTAHGAYGGFSDQHVHSAHSQGGQMVADMGCYGLHSNGEFADISSLEPSIYPQQMLADEQHQFGPSHQNNYQSATLPTVSSGQQLYRPVPFNNSPTGSSQASTGSEEGEEFYANWHPYKRSPPNASLMIASAVGGELLDSKKRGGKATKKRKPKKDPNEPQKPVSAYALFFRDTQAAIKGQNPNASFGEVSKIVASMWDSLDAEAKNNYKQKTEVAKKDYLKQLAAYRANQISRSGGNPCSMMEALGHGDYSAANNSGKLFGQGTAGSSPDSTTSHASDSKEAMAAADLGGKSLASMIAEPAPQQVLTATTTLTLRNKSDYDDSSDGSSYPLCVRTNNTNEQSDGQWDNDFRPNEGLVQHCRDVFNIWGPSRPPPSSAAPPGYLPV